MYYENKLPTVINCLTLLFLINGCSTADDIENHPNLNLLPKQCGEIKEGYILTDKPHFEEFPWMTLVTIKSKNTDKAVRFGCSGTLINSRYVLTAAHCAKFATGVRIGEYNINTTNDCEGEGQEIICTLPYQDVGLEKIVIHPEYNSYFNDIALLRLETPVDFEKPNAGAICLPTTNNLRNLDLSKESGTLAGWRLLQNPSTLTKSKADIYSEEDCKSYYGNITKGLLFNSLCVNNSLFFESGVPLMIKSTHEGHDRYTQYGFEKAGKKNNATSIFLDVTKYMKWILDTIKP